MQHPNQKPQGGGAESCLMAWCVLRSGSGFLEIGTQLLASAAVRTCVSGFCLLGIWLLGLVENLPALCVLISICVLPHAACCARLSLSLLICLTIDTFCAAATNGLLERLLHEEEWPMLLRVTFDLNETFTVQLVPDFNMQLR